MAGNQKPTDPPALASAGGGQLPFETGTTVKQPGSVEWPLKWLNEAVSEGWRLWAPGSHVGHVSKPAPEKRLRAADDQDGVGPTSIDRQLHASMGRLTLGVAPASLWLAYADWAIHLLASPGKYQQLAETRVRKTIRIMTYLTRFAADPNCLPCVEPLRLCGKITGSKARSGSNGRST